MTNDNNINLKPWHIALIVLVSGVLMVWGVSSIYHNSKQRQRHHAERELQIISQMQSQSLLAWRESRLTDAEVLTDDLQIGRVFAAWLRPSEAATTATDQALLQSELRMLLEHKNYSAAYLIDTDGNIRLTPDGVYTQELPSPEAQALRTAFAHAQVETIEPRRDDMFAFPFFSMLAPIYDADQPVGAVWLVSDVRASLYPLLERWPSGSATAESVILVQEGDEALILSPFRHRPDVILPFRISLTQRSDPAVQLVMGMRGVFYSRDYRDEPVLAVANIVPGSSWFLLTKIDTREVFATEWREFMMLGLPSIFSLLYVGAILIYLQRRAWRRERKLKRRLERTLHWLENAQKTASVGYFGYSLKSRKFSISSTSRNVFGFVAGKTMTLERWLSSVHPADRKQVVTAYRQAINHNVPLRLQHRILRESDKRERWVETWGEYETDLNDPDRTRLIGTLQDITERMLIEKELEQVRMALEAQVRRDSLTQVANRLALDERLVVEWSRATRHRSPLSMLMIDVDQFKLFNDRYGHVAGDECLQRVAWAISAVAKRSQDLVARYGGEEFVVLLPDTDCQSASELAERIRVAVRAEAIPHVYAPAPSRVTVSIGVVCVHPDPDESVESGVRAFLERVDVALYKAKNKGRDCVVTDEYSEPVQQW